MADLPPDDFDEQQQQLDALIDIEQEIRNEQENEQMEEEELEGGGFFPESSEAGESAAPGTARSSISDDPNSIDDDPPAKPYAHGCRECGSIGIQKNFETAYGIRVCFRCQQIHKSRYQLITQTTATTQYMLPLPLVQTLGFIEKQNPQQKAWGSMKLYWKQQVLALVRQRYGTKENLEKAKLERDMTRIRKDDSKRRVAHQSAARSAAFASTLAASMSELGSQTPAEVVALLQARTKGMAPTTTKDRNRGRKKKRKNTEAEEAKEEGDDDGGAPAAAEDADSDIEVIEPTATKKRSKTSSSAESKSKKPILHTHSFVMIADGRQQCSDPSCRFTMEFESF
jgi:DNA repair protein